MTIYHIELNVKSIEASAKFYDLILPPIGFTCFHTEPGYMGYTNGSESVFLAETDIRYQHHGFHRKRPGVNHIAFRARSKTDVDHFYKDVLLAHRLPVIYGGPQEYPEYHPGYYAVYFEDPDRLKLELVFTPELKPPARRPRLD